MLIIANQKKDLFKSLKEINDLSIEHEEIDYEFYKNEKGRRLAKPVYGDYLFIVNSKVYARYKTKEEKEIVLDQLIKALCSDEKLFIFPVCIESKNIKVMEN